MTIRTLESGDRYQVMESSGDVYQVMYSGHTGQRFKGFWQCECPSGIHNMGCKHVKALLSVMEIIEGIENESGEHIAEIEVA